VGFRVPLDFLFQRCLISTLQWETTNRGFGSCERNDGVAPKLFGNSGRSAHGTGHEDAHPSLRRQGLFRRGELKAGQTILIHGGSGGVGHHAIQFAKAKGARVLTTVSTGNVQFARDLGADVIIDCKKQR
jgi:hypothetical protein